MNLYLLRHGEAERRDHDDPGRALTSRGRREVESVARQFALRDIPLERCIASPYTRARQTAELFMASAGVDGPLEYSELLVPETPSSQTLSFVSSLNARDVLLVSHNPLLSELGALLLDGTLSRMQVQATSELVCIALDLVGPGLGTCSFRLLPTPVVPHA